MSLSVKSMHSCSRAAPRFSMAGILWPVVTREAMYQLALLFDASIAICPFQEIVWVQGLPRRSSSRSLRGFRKDSELPMSSAVRRMAAVFYWVVVGGWVGYTIGSVCAQVIVRVVSRIECCMRLADGTGSLWVEESST